MDASSAQVRDPTDNATDPLTRSRKAGPAPMTKRPKRSGSKPGRGFFERIMFSFMGPPQIGENKVREGYVPDAAADLCPKCGQPWDAHQRVHTGTMTYRVCPEQA